MEPGPDGSVRWESAIKTNLGRAEWEEMVAVAHLENVLEIVLGEEDDEEGEDGNRYQGEEEEEGADGRGCPQKRVTG